MHSPPDNTYLGRSHPQDRKMSGFFESLGDHMTYAIQADSLEKRFGETQALAGVSLTAEPGTVLGVLGPNGAGKTTATRVLATLIEPTAGSAQVGGFDVVKEAHKVRQLIGLTGQYAGVDEMLTGTENLILIGRLLGRSEEHTSELQSRFDLVCRL